MTNIDLLTDLRQQLHADGLCGIGTLLRRYGLDRATMEQAVLNAGGWLTSRNVEAVRGQRRSARVYQFAHAAPRYGLHDPVVQAHMAGLAELRLILVAEPEDWARINAQLGQHMADRRDTPEWRRGVTKNPDAYWTVDGEQRWMEYDRGTYIFKDRHLKIMAAVAEEHPLYWGDPSPERLARVQRQATAYVAAELERGRKNSFGRQAHLNFHPVPTYWHVRSEVDFDHEDGRG